MSIRLKKFSYRFAEEVINSKLNIKNEIEEILYESTKNLSILSRREFNNVLETEFQNRGWTSQPQVFENDNEAHARFDFMKNRIGVEVQFGHASFIGIDLLKFQVASYSGLNSIDFGVYITTTAAFQRYVSNNYGLTWNGSLCFEKVTRYLPLFRSAIQVPIYVIGIDI